MHNNYINIKIHNMPIFFATHFAQQKRRHANPLNIDLIFMDVMCCDVGRDASVHFGAWKKGL